MQNIDVNELVEKIIDSAKKTGADNSLFFIKTFEQYKNLLKLQSDCLRAIENEGSMVTKEYVKGRGNLYVNPAMKTYDSLCKTTNQTVSTLIKIVGVQNMTSITEVDNDEDDF